jgi:hypothetical protein
LLLERVASSLAYHSSVQIKFNSNLLERVISILSFTVT